MPGLCPWCTKLSVDGDEVPVTPLWEQQLRASGSQGGRRLGVVGREIQFQWAPLQMCAVAS